MTTGTFGLKRSRFKPSRAGSCWLFGGSCDYPWLQINDECIVIHTGKNSRDDAREICGTNMVLPIMQISYQHTYIACSHVYYVYHINIVHHIYTYHINIHKIPIYVYIHIMFQKTSSNLLFFVS